MTKVVIVGGVAGGASAAARLRRLDEHAQIILFERGEYISFANCGLPYHVGKVISQRDNLLVMTPEKFYARTNIDVRIRSEVIRIDRQQKKVIYRHVETDTYGEESYDFLILATGSSPIRPPIPGAEDRDVLQLWTIPDMDGIISRIEAGARSAVVVGGGFIGLEIAENLRYRGLQVDLVEMLPQVLPPLDPEMSSPLITELQRHGVRLHLGHQVTAIDRKLDAEVQHPALLVKLDNGEQLAADFVILSVGVRPNSQLAKEAGLDITERGGIRVNEYLQTSDPAIYAVGDVIALPHSITGETVQIPLAGPANRQGRIAADNICGRKVRYKGVLGTSIVKVFSTVVANTGLNEKQLKRIQQPYHKIYIHPTSHASYYPGADLLSIKVIFSPEGKILGAQILGREGVDKRIDLLATAIQSGLPIRALEDLELAYAPPFGSAKDPINLIGMVASNFLDGLHPIVHVEDLKPDDFIIDVREPAEHELGSIPGSILIPLGKIRSRLAEIPKNRRIVLYCRVGLRGYLATRILRQAGYDAYNLSGGWLTYLLHYPQKGQFPLPPIDGTLNSKYPSSSVSPCVSSSCTHNENNSQKGGVKQQEVSFSVNRELDVSSLQCPGPIVRLKETMESLKAGDVLCLTASCSFSHDLEAWIRSTGHKLLTTQTHNGLLKAWIQKSTSSVVQQDSYPLSQPSEAAIVLFSGDLDRALAALIIATGLASLGTHVSIFFTFWGLNVLRKAQPPKVKKDWLSKMFGWMMPCGAKKLALSKMHMAGLGTALMKYVMQKKNVLSLEDLIKEAKKLGVKFIACEMAMNVMGLKKEELIDEIEEIAGVPAFAELARRGHPTLFI